MLRATLEILPHGHDARARVIGRMAVVNLGALQGTTCAYAGVVWDDQVLRQPARAAVAHDRADGAWSLVAQVIEHHGDSARVQFVAPGLWNRLAARLEPPHHP